MKILSTTQMKIIAGGHKELTVTQKIPLTGVSENCIQALSSSPSLLQSLTHAFNSTGVTEMLVSDLATNCCSVDRSILLDNTDRPYLTVEYT